MGTLCVCVKAFILFQRNDTEQQKSNKSIGLKALCGEYLEYLTRILLTFEVSVLSCENTTF